MVLRDVLILVFGAIVSYLLGGISVARIITSRRKEGSIVNNGSGNPGTMNMLRTHGLIMGLSTLFFDALKGALPSLFGLLYYGSYGEKIAYMALFIFGFCAVIGHIFPVYYRFKGGKGIATTLGVFVVADPLTTAILFAILFVTLYFIKISSVVSLLFITINAIVQLFRSYSKANWVVIILMVGMVLVDIIAHKQNLIRLIDDKENTADLHEGLIKDIEKLKNKKKQKLEKNTEKKKKINEKYERKIAKKHEKISKKIAKLNASQDGQVEVQSVEKKDNTITKTTKKK